MKSSDIANVAIAALSLAFVMFATMLGVIIRITRKWTVIEDGLATLTRDFSRMADDNAKTAQEMAATMRDDRRATHERLTWLERNIWPRHAGSMPGRQGP